MKIEEPAYRFSKNWDKVANLFSYTIHPDDQDWTYTIAEPHMIDNYIAAYDIEITDEESKFTLMEIIIQSLNDQGSSKQIKKKWPSVKRLLDKDFALHQYTVYYWCSWDVEDENNLWEVSPVLREYWQDR